MKERVLRRDHDLNEQSNRKKAKTHENEMICLKEIQYEKFEKITGRENKIEWATSR